MIDSVSPLAAAPSVTQTSGKSPKDIKSAAQQFEALLTAQLLKSARETSGGWLGSGEDAAASSAIELAEEQFAQALSSQGGLGLASMIERSMAPVNKTVESRSGE
jgi:Rod binding domain-containing protein